MAGKNTKQFLLNHDSGYLFPYTTLDCIIGENGIGEGSNSSGTTTILSQIFDKGVDDGGANITLNDTNKNQVSAISFLGVGRYNDKSIFVRLAGVNTGASLTYLGIDGAPHGLSSTYFGENNNNIIVKNADSAELAKKANEADKLGTNAGSTTKPVYFTDGKPTECTSIDLIASSAAKLTSSAGAENKPIFFKDGVPIVCSGTLDFTTLKATALTSTSTGNDATPVYFDANGQPQACTRISLKADTAGLADKATALVSTSVGTSTSPVFINSNGLPEQCGKINSASNADSAGFATTASKLGSSTSESTTAGDLSTPVYFANGVPSPCTSISLTANKAQALTAVSVGNTGKPVYIDSAGVPQECARFLSGVNASGARKLVDNNDNDITEGSLTAPIYFKNGIPTACTNNTATLVTYYDNAGNTISNGIGAGGSTAEPNAVVITNDGKLTKSSQFEYVKSYTTNTNLQNPADITGFYITTDVIDTNSGNRYWTSTLPLRMLEAPADITKDYVLKYKHDNSGTKMEWALPTNQVEQAAYIQTEKYYLTGVTAPATETTPIGTVTVAKSGLTGIYVEGMKLYNTSDERLKTFISDVDIDFDNLATIKKGVFYWNNDPEKVTDIGVTAQSVEPLYPELVDENNGVKSVSYNGLGVIALAAIDKLHLRIKELEREIEELKKK